MIVRQVTNYKTSFSFTWAPTSFDSGDLFCRSFADESIHKKKEEAPGVSYIELGGSLRI